MHLCSIGPEQDDLIRYIHPNKNWKFVERQMLKIVAVAIWVLLFVTQAAAAFLVYRNADGQITTVIPPDGATFETPLDENGAHFWPRVGDYFYLGSPVVVCYTAKAFLDLELARAESPEKETNLKKLLFTTKDTTCAEMDYSLGVFLEEKVATIAIDGERPKYIIKANVGPGATLYFVEKWYPNPESSE